jgi:hypothetical protein
MATDKYLNLQGLTEVAEKVNKKLRTVTTMPATPTINDVVLYNGAAGIYIPGCTYRYEIAETYYAWSDLSDTYYTKAASPQEGDSVYSDAQGTDSGYTVEAYDSTNNIITINSIDYNRDSMGDTPVYAWVNKYGGTSVILNEVDKTGSEASFYAPTVSGVSGQTLISNGVGRAPSWGSLSGYSPAIVDDSLVFTYGVIPAVNGTSLVLNV